GYIGGYTQVKEYVREVRPIPPPDPVVRFETPPGLQAQVDFAEFRLPWGKRFALLVVLGYSRLMWVRFYPCQTMVVVVLMPVGHRLGDALIFKLHESQYQFVVRQAAAGHCS